MFGDWAGGRILLHPHDAARRDDLFIIVRMKGVWMDHDVFLIKDLRDGICCEPHGGCVGDR